MVDVKIICDNCVFCEKGGFFTKLFGSNWKCKHPAWTKVDKNGKEHYPSCFSRNAISGFQDTCVNRKEK